MPTKYTKILLATHEIITTLFIIATKSTAENSGFLRTRNSTRICSRSSKALLSMLYHSIAPYNIRLPVSLPGCVWLSLAVFLSDASPPCIYSPVPLLHYYSPLEIRTQRTILSPYICILSSSPVLICAVLALGLFTFSLNDQYISTVLWIVLWLMSLPPLSLFFPSSDDLTQTNKFGRASCDNVILANSYATRLLNTPAWLLYALTE